MVVIGYNRYSIEWAADISFACIWLGLSLFLALFFAPIIYLVCEVLIAIFVRVPKVTVKRIRQWAYEKDEKPKREKKKIEQNQYLVDEVEEDRPTRLTDLFESTENSRNN